MATKDEQWVSFRTDADEARKMKLIAANMGMTRSEFVRHAVTERMQKYLRQATAENRHPAVPLGTPGTSPVTCGMCGETEVRTEWELADHGRCRAETGPCAICATEKERNL